MWRKATARLFGKERIQQITTSSAKSVCEHIRSESKVKPDGFDPRDIFTLGTLNTVSDFALGKKYEFNDPQFGEIVVAVDKWFHNLLPSIQFRMMINILPVYITSTRMFYFITQMLFTGNYEFLECLYGERGLVGAILRQVHEHEKSIDTENPRDFTGMFELLFFCFILLIKIY